MRPKATSKDGLEAASVSQLTAQLFADDTAFEPAMLAWLSLQLSLNKPVTETEVFENVGLLAGLLQSRRFKREVQGHPLMTKPTIQGLVSWESEVWVSLKEIDIFKVLSQGLEPFFSPGFDFESSFTDVFYSHPGKVSLCLLVASLMTILIVQEEEEGEYDFSIVKVPEELGADTQMALTRLFRVVLDLLDALSLDDEAVLSLSQPSLKRSVSKFGKEDSVMVRKLDQLASQNDNFTKTIAQMKAENEILRESLTSKEHEMLELENRFGRVQKMYDDLTQKIKNRTFDLISDEIRERDEKLADLVMQVRARDDKISGLEVQIEGLYEEKFKTDNELRITKLLLEEKGGGTESASVEGHEPPRENLEDLERELRRLEKELLQEKQRTMEHDLKTNKLEQELEKAIHDKIEIEGQLNAVNQDPNLMSSLLFIQDFDDLLAEISSPEVINRVQTALFHRPSEPDDNLDILSVEDHTKKMGSFEIIRPFNPERSGVAMEVVGIVRGYQNDVKVKFKTLLVELSDKRETLKRVLEDLEKMKDEIEDLAFRADENENKIVVEVLSKNGELKETFLSVKESLAQDTAILSELLQKIAKKEAEVIRLVHSRRRTQNELLTLEAGHSKALELVYTTVVQQLLSNVS